MLNVMRKVSTDYVNEDAIQVGDQIRIPIDGFGTFTATAEEVTDSTILFIFDEYIVRRPMNEKNTNEGGFKGSQLYKWLQDVLLPAFPDYLRERIHELTIPTIGQVSGWSDTWDKEHFVNDDDQQLPLMTDQKHRIALFKEKIDWYWLQNASCWSSTYFAYVNGRGGTNYESASASGGVRPAFRLVKEKSGGFVPQSDVASMHPHSAIAEMLFGAKKINPYNEMARETKALMDAYVNAGFTEKQAFHMVVSLSTAVIGGMV